MCPFVFQSDAYTIATVTIHWTYPSIYEGFNRNSSANNRNRDARARQPTKVKGLALAHTSQGVCTQCSVHDVLLTLTYSQHSTEITTTIIPPYIKRFPIRPPPPHTPTLLQGHVTYERSELKVIYLISFRLFIVFAL